MLRSLELASALLGAGIGYASMKSPLGIAVGALGGYGSVKVSNYALENITDIATRRFLVKLVTVGAANTLVYVLTGSETAAFLAGGVMLHINNNYIQRPIVAQYDDNNRRQTTNTGIAPVPPQTAPQNNY
jgi:hypothetical protein